MLHLYTRREADARKHLPSKAGRMMIERTAPYRHRDLRQDPAIEERSGQPRVGGPARLSGFGSQVRLRRRLTRMTPPEDRSSCTLPKPLGSHSMDIRPRWSK